MPSLLQDLRIKAFAPWSVPRVWQQALLPFAGLLALLLLLYRHTGEAMVLIWARSETYAHAYVVPPIVLWLVWRQRHELRQITPKVDSWMLLPTALAALAWLVGDVAAANSVTQMAYMAMLVLSVPLLLGRQVAWCLLFPLTFAFFAVPVGEALTPTLMQWTADFTVAALRASGVPVYREGLRFVIPSGSWSVVEACSGIRYLMASFMVGSLFAYLNYNSTRRRLIFVAISLVLPIVANWLRAYMIVMLGHLSNNRIATGADHILYGWVFFGIVIMLLFWIGARWAEPMLITPDLPPATGVWPAALGWSVAVLSLSVLALPLWASQHIGSAEPEVAIQLDLPAELAGGWRAAPVLAPTWQPVLVNPNARARASFQSPAGATVGVVMGYYRQQTGLRKVVSSSHVLVAYEDHDWIELPGAVRKIALARGPQDVREARVLQVEVAGSPRRQRLLVWKLYWIDGQLVSGDLRGKLMGAWARLAGRGDDAALLLLYADEPDDAQSERALTRFMETASRALVGQLETARKRAQPH